MKSLLPSPRNPRPTIDRPETVSTIFTGWGPRIAR